METVDPVVDPDIMRLAMRNWATGVTVVSSYHNGIRHGMTVSASFLSNIPPVVDFITGSNMIGIFLLFSLSWIIFYRGVIVHHPNHYHIDFKIR